MNNHQDHLIWYMLFLRVTPLLPNWFINYASPIVGMPFKHFIVGTCLGKQLSSEFSEFLIYTGLLPNSFILVRTGLLLHEVTEFGLNFKVFASYSLSSDNMMILHSRRSFSWLDWRCWCWYQLWFQRKKTRNLKLNWKRTKLNN